MASRDNNKHEKIHSIFAVYTSKFLRGLDMRRTSYVPCCTNINYFACNLVCQQYIYTHLVLTCSCASLALKGVVIFYYMVKIEMFQTRNDQCITIMLSKHDEMTTPEVFFSHADNVSLNG